MPGLVSNDYPVTTSAPFPGTHEQLACKLSPLVVGPKFASQRSCIFFRFLGQTHSHSSSLTAIIRRPCTLASGPREAQETRLGLVPGNALHPALERGASLFALTSGELVVRMTTCTAALWVPWGLSTALIPHLDLMELRP